MSYDKKYIYQNNFIQKVWRWSRESLFLWNDVKILHKETNRFKRVFSGMVYKKKESDNSLNKITDIEHLNSAYNMILDFLS